MSNKSTSSPSSQFRHESIQDSRAIVRYLNALAEGFEQCTLRFRDQQGEIALETNGMIRFGVTADHKSDRYGVTIKLSWKQARTDDKDSGPLMINGALEEDRKDEE